MGAPRRARTGVVVHPVDGDRVDYAFENAKTLLREVKMDDRHNGLLTFYAPKRGPLVEGEDGEDNASNNKVSPRFFWLELPKSRGEDEKVLVYQRKKEATAAEGTYGGVFIYDLVQNAKDMLTILKDGGMYPKVCAACIRLLANHNAVFLQAGRPSKGDELLVKDIPRRIALKQFDSNTDNNTENKAATYGTEKSMVKALQHMEGGPACEYLVASAAPKGTMYILMSVVDETLAEHRGGVRSPEMVFAVLRGMVKGAEALAAASNGKLWYTDMKCENVGVSTNQDGETAVNFIDLGSITEMGWEGTVVNTYSLFNSVAMHTRLCEQVACWGIVAVACDIMFPNPDGRAYLSREHLREDNAIGLDVDEMVSGVGGDKRANPSDVLAAHKLVALSAISNLENIVSEEEIRRIKEDEPADEDQEAAVFSLEAYRIMFGAFMADGNPKCAVYRPFFESLGLTQTMIHGGPLAVLEWQKKLTLKKLAAAIAHADGAAKRSPLYAVDGEADPDQAIRSQPRSKGSLAYFVKGLKGEQMTPEDAWNEYRDVNTQEAVRLCNLMDAGERAAYLDALSTQAGYVAIAWAARAVLNTRECRLFQEHPTSALRASLMDLANSMYVTRGDVRKRETLEYIWFRENGTDSVLSSVRSVFCGLPVATCFQTVAGDDDAFEGLLCFGYIVDVSYAEDAKHDNPVTSLDAPAYPGFPDIDLWKSPDAQAGLDAIIEAVDAIDNDEHLMKVDHEWGCNFVQLTQGIAGDTDDFTSSDRCRFKCTMVFQNGRRLLNVKLTEAMMMVLAVRNTLESKVCMATYPNSFMMMTPWRPNNDKRWYDVNTVYGVMDYIDPKKTDKDKKPWRDEAANLHKSAGKTASQLLQRAVDAEQRRVALADEARAVKTALEGAEEGSAEEEELDDKMGELLAAVVELMNEEVKSACVHAFPTSTTLEELKANHWGQLYNEKKLVVAGNLHPKVCMAMFDALNRQGGIDSKEISEWFTKNNKFMYYGEDPVSPALPLFNAMVFSERVPFTEVMADATKKSRRSSDRGEGPKAKKTTPRRSVQRRQPAQQMEDDRW